MDGSVESMGIETVESQAFVKCFEMEGAIKVRDIILKKKKL